MEQSTSSFEPIRVFYSYSHKDERLRVQLETHLAILRRQGLISEWHDRQIDAGEEWKAKIDENLEAAHMVLLLVSADFIDSEYCYSIEMEAALKRHESGHACVIPIIIRPCVWNSLAFGKLQALPKDAKPVTTWSNREKAFVDITQGIQRAAEEIVRSREARARLASNPRQASEWSDKRIIDFEGERISTAIQSKWELSNCRLLDAHVISYPFDSTLGGDFCAGKIIDNDNAGILLLDGQGHGVAGSLHMIPFMTAFESAWQSYSTAHVIGQLAKISEAVGVRATAIYCIFSSIDKKTWLSVTSAGHERLILFRNHQRGGWEVKYAPAFWGSMLGSPSHEPINAERVELFPEEIVVGYTDGIAWGDGTPFGANDVIALVMNVLAQQGNNPKDIAEAIMEGSRSRHSEGFEDDATVFVVRVK
jgi:stage II sporulation SpoE-like protein/TIR domain-containing protein